GNRARSQETRGDPASHPAAGPRQGHGPSDLAVRAPAELWPPGGGIGAGPDRRLSVVRAVRGREAQAEMSMRPVIRAVRLVLVHADAPSLVRLGSKPLRVLRELDRPVEYLRPHLRDWRAACDYVPNQVFIGNATVDDLAARPVPWHRHPIVGAQRFGPDGEI